MQNPFTTTFSKTPKQTYISTDEINEILENFSYDSPSESVYKITGVRGSGKTVLLAKLEEELKNNSASAAEWHIFDLNPTRDMLVQMASMLQKEGYGKSAHKNKSINVSANILGTGGGIGYTSENRFFDMGVEIEAIFKEVQKKKRKILIGIDEISKTDAMIEFTSEFGKWLRADYPVYLVCTGLYENISELSNVKNLTFFRRATTIKTEPLNFIRMAEMYKKQLGIDSREAKWMAKCTKGYAYAFQELGVLYFKGKSAGRPENLISDLKTELFAYSYEKIWEEMSDGDRFLSSLLTDKEEYKREEVLRLMGEKSSGYSVYRDRLIKRGILSSRQGYISLALPFFGDYIKEYSDY